MHVGHEFMTELFILQRLYMSDIYLSPYPVSNTNTTLILKKKKIFDILRKLIEHFEMLIGYFGEAVFINKVSVPKIFIKQYLYEVLLCLKLQGDCTVCKY